MACRARRPRAHRDRRPVAQPPGRADARAQARAGADPAAARPRRGGVLCAETVLHRAERLGVEMPITAAVVQVLRGSLTLSRRARRADGRSARPSTDRPDTTFLHPTARSPYPCSAETSSRRSPPSPPPTRFRVAGLRSGPAGAADQDGRAVPAGQFAGHHRAHRRRAAGPCARAAGGDRQPAWRGRQRRHWRRRARRARRLHVAAVHDPGGCW